MTEGTYNLQRFVDAQTTVYPQIEKELRAGYKTSHWIWFVFPQIRGLGHSAMAQRYAITSLAEARAYLDHPLLGARLRAATQFVTRVKGRALAEILGHPDDLKFHSSITLFSRAAPHDVYFSTALKKYFASRPDAATIELLN